MLAPCLHARCTLGACRACRALCVCRRFYLSTRLHNDLRATTRRGRGRRSGATRTLPATTRATSTRTISCRTSTPSCERRRLEEEEAAAAAAAAVAVAVAAVGGEAAEARPPHLGMCPRVCPRVCLRVWRLSPTSTRFRRPRRRSRLAGFPRFDRQHSSFGLLHALLFLFLSHACPLPRCCRSLLAWPLIALTRGRNSVPFFQRHLPAWCTGGCTGTALAGPAAARLQRRSPAPLLGLARRRCYSRRGGGACGGWRGGL